jgi:hypothetical protein
MGFRRHRTSLRPLVVGLLLAFGTVATPLRPAAAVTPVSIDGTFTVDGSTFPFPDPGLGPCTAPLTTFDIVPSGSSTSGTWTLTGQFGYQFQFAGSPTWHMARVVVLAGTGGYTTTSPPPGRTYKLTSTALNHVTFQAEYWTPDPTTCVPGAPQCTFRTRLVLRGDSGHTGTLPAIGVGDTSLVDMSTSGGGVPMTVYPFTPAALAACQATPFDVLIGGTVDALVDLTF